MYRWESFILNQANTTQVNTEFQVNTVGTINQTPIGGFRSFEVELEAGESIVTSQNAGTNAEFNIFAEVLELPA